MANSTTGECAWIYDRVSSKPQSSGYSLETQLEGCKEHCERLGYRVDRDFTEVFTSTTHERPVLREMLEALATNPPDVVVAWDLDRLLGRDELGQVLVKYEILESGARIEYARDGSGHGERDELLQGMKGIIARRENRDRTERMMRTKRARIRNGYPLMSGDRVNFGYTYRSEKRKGWLTINDEEAAIVRDMYRWLIQEQLSTYTIAKRLTDRGVLTRGDKSAQVVKRAGRGRWNPSAVHYLLSNPIYKGEYYYGKTKRVKRPAGARKPNGEPYKTRSKIVKMPPKEWIMVEVPAVVDEETWDAAQRQLAKNSELSKRNTRRQYLLRGMIYCHCGRRGTANLRSGSDYAYYRCTQLAPWLTECESRFSIRQEVIEEAIWDAVVDYLRHPDRMIADVERRQRERAGDIARAEREAQAAAAGIADIDRKLAQLLDEALEGYPKRIIDQKRNELTAERSQLVGEQERLERLRAEVEITPDTAAMLGEIAKDFERVLPLMTFEDKRRWLKLLQLRVDVIDRDTVQLSGLLSDTLVPITSVCIR